MTPKSQKGKGGKRRRAWHHGPNEDAKFDEAVQKLDKAVSENPTRKELHMMLRINNEPIKAEGLMFIYDGCHKVYLVTSEAGRRQLLECGWSQDDFRHPSELPAVWEQTCPLRFISDADLNTMYVEQGDDALVEWVSDNGHPPTKETQKDESDE
jgi:hypothetical protein